MPTIYELADQFRERVVAREAAASSALVQSYGQAWTAIQEQLTVLTAEIEAEKKAGRQVSTDWLFRQERLGKLLSDVEEQVHEFARTAEDKIVNEQAAAVSAGQDHADKLLTAAVSETPQPGVIAHFAAAPKETLGELVGFLADGSPLRDLLDKLGPDASDEARKVIVQGVALGQNPKVIADNLRESLGGNLDRALTIARTEVLRSYREATRQTYQANKDVVEGYVWVASLSLRTCAMCIAMHGTFHETSQVFGTHPNCRCTMVPRTKSLAQITGNPAIPDTRPQIETGPEWFAKQPEETQRAILGPGKLELYQAGDLDLSELIGYRDDKKWGPNRWEKSLKAVQSSKEAP